MSFMMCVVVEGSISCSRIYQYLAFAALMMAGAMLVEESVPNAQV
jgi:hypothetical protein